MALVLETDLAMLRQLFELCRSSGVVRLEFSGIKVELEPEPRPLPPPIAQGRGEPNESGAAGASGRPRCLKCGAHVAVGGLPCWDCCQAPASPAVRDDLPPWAHGLPVPR